MERASDLASRFTALGARDAIHAALCLRYGLALISADRDFDAVTELQRIDPLTAAGGAG